MENGEKETWADTVIRAVDGNVALVDAKFIEDGEREKLIKLLYPFAAIPAGRHLNASGMKGRQFLFNCLAGQTRVMTKKGWMSISECARIGDLEVLAQGAKEQTGIGCWTYGQGEWRKANFKYFGEQELFTVTFSDGTEVEATADHKWYVTKRSNPVETTNLVGLSVPFVTAPKPEKGEMFQAAVLHGFTFGDGNLSTYKGKPHSSHVRMFAEKDNDVAELFQKAGFDVTHPSHCNAYVGRLPAEWKFLPSEDASLEYWYGFIVGLLAADGTVSEQSGSVIMYQSDKDALELVRSKSMECGFACTPVMLQREKNPWTGESAPNWRFTFRRFSVQPQELILQQHRINFEAAGESTSGRSLEVLSVRNTNRKEGVFCAIEPETQTFVIENNLLTGNCHAAGWDKAEPSAHFEFLFDCLMQGGGVGSNYSNRYLEQMPPVSTRLDLHIVCREDHPDIAEFQHLLCDVMKGDVKSHNDRHAVGDSREGWVDSAGLVLRTAFEVPKDPEHTEKRLVVDVSGIRRRGSELKTGGGIACGPGPLVKMLSNVAKHLNGCYGRQLTSEDAMVIDHSEADCVVAGGKRRSSRMSVKNWKDKDIFEFINCKRTDGAHWTTNISVEIGDDFHRAYLKEDPHARAVMRAVVLGKRTNGEPGLWDIDLARKGEREPDEMFCPNPCGEICLHMWENCNLGHINLEYFARGPRGPMMEAFRLMTRWLIRATFGDIPSPRQRKVVDRNRRISVGFFGYQAYLNLRGIKYSDGWKEESVIKMLKEARSTVETEAFTYATSQGIPIPTKNTGLAPTGSIVCMPGTTPSAQTIVDPWYLRRVRYADDDAELKMKISEGYKNYPDPDAQNTTIVEYWCEDPLIAKVRASGWDISIVEGQKEVSVDNYLQTQAMLQDHFVDNAISFTIPLGEHNTPSEDEMEASIVSVLGRVKGTTMYPDRSRKNSPFESLTREQFENYKGRKEITTVEQECIGGCPVG